MQNPFEWLVGQWTLRFGEITLTMGDFQPKMHFVPTDESAIEDDLLWWEQPFSCTPDSPVWIGCGEEAWSEIGKLILAAAGVDPAPASEIRSTYLEIVSQSMGSLAQDIGNELSTEVSSVKGAEESPQPVLRHHFKIETELPNRTVVFYFVAADALGEALTAAAANPAVSVPEIKHEEPSHAVAPLEPAPAPSPALSGSRTFELLLDVELPVSVSFGRTVLKLQDAMQLITGSLIELNRTVSDPVELLVNNSVIARGEVVVIEGNYGVRVTEIISHQERLQHSRRYLLQ